MEKKQTARNSWLQKKESAEDEHMSILRKLVCRQAPCEDTNAKLTELEITALCSIKTVSTPQPPLNLS